MDQNWRVWILLACVALSLSGSVFTGFHFALGGFLILLIMWGIVELVIGMAREAMKPSPPDAPRFTLREGAHILLALASGVALLFFFVWIQGRL